ncbi:hypothetical protein ACGFNU_40115 [Spirillospora sp. NPDC048911]|uniref:hypothetical protein n=1 Tax=Spirillospora sp. NPDC048911 TaxID=3364527 RepID=UPI003720DF81
MRTTRVATKTGLVGLASAAAALSLGVTPAGAATANAPAGDPAPVLQVQQQAPVKAGVADLRAAGVPEKDVHAAGYKKKTVKLRWCWGEKKPKLGKASGTRCAFLGVWVDYTFVYNGKRVYQHRVACDDKGIYNPLWSWCGYTRNGKSWMSAGGNFKTRLGIGPVNASVAYWMRMYATNKGRVTTSGGKA